MLFLAKKTGQKQTAHQVIHQVAMEAFERGIPFQEHIIEHPLVREHLTREEIVNLLLPENYLGLIDMCIDSVLSS
jgi:adenylosuccinate lyase